MGWPAPETSEDSKTKMAIHRQPWATLKHPQDSRNWKVCQDSNEEQIPGRGVGVGGK